MKLTKWAFPLFLISATLANVGVCARDVTAESDPARWQLEYPSSSILRIPEGSHLTEHIACNGGEAVVIYTIKHPHKKDTEWTMVIYEHDQYGQLPKRRQLCRS